jgi:hypothetical protein
VAQNLRYTVYPGPGWRGDPSENTHGRLWEKTKSRGGVKFVVVPVRNGYVARPIIPHLPVKL